MNKLIVIPELLALDWGTSSLRAFLMADGEVLETYAKQLLLEGLSNKEALAKTLEQFPTAKTTVACIAYYRNKLVADGKLVSSRTAKAAQAPAQEPAQEAA